MTPHAPPHASRRSLAAVLLAGLAAAVAGCGGGGAADVPPAPPGKLQVVAAEDVWGSLASQLGGARAAVSSVISSPDADPHSYEPTAADGVRFARCRMAIVNGIGYDPWASRMLAASPSGGRVALDVGGLLGLQEGDNPHQWYSPASVRRVIGAIAAGYVRLDPKDAAYFQRRRRLLEGRGLAEYDRLLAQIRARYAGVPVGFSESVFQPLGRSLGLRLKTPGGFARAVAEGTDVSAQDKQTVDRQAERRLIDVWVYNSQNLTPDVQQVNRLARAARIPVVAVTETLAPAGASFQQWQDAQLRRLMAALHRATGR